MHDVECEQQRIGRVKMNEAKRGGHVRLLASRLLRFKKSH